MKKHIKPDVDKVKPLKAEPKPYLPDVDELPSVKHKEVISKWGLFIIHLKELIESLTKETATIGFNSLFSKAKSALWWIIIMVGIAIVFKILKG